MVQELLLRAALNGQNAPQAPMANISQGQKPLSNNMRNEQSALLNTLLKSLYINNARNQGNSNINNVNNFTAQKMPQMQQQVQSIPQEQAFEEFLKQDPDFFKGREMLFDYLSSCGANCDSEELSKIAQLAKTMEEEAIKRFCAKNPRYAQFLQSENQKALSKLENTANIGVEGTFKDTPVFSAQDISKMSSDEFLKNEDAINAQINALLRNG